MRNIATALAGLALALACGCGRPEPGCARPPAAGGVLVLATTKGSAPYSDYDETTGAFVGISIDLARAAARRMGLPLEIVAMDFSELIPAVKSGRADFAVEAITITPSRLRDVDFSLSYASDGGAFLYRRGEDCPTVPTAGRFRIAVQTGSLCQFYLCYHDVDPVCYPEYADAVEALDAGRLDAVFHDAESIRHTIRCTPGRYAMSPLETRENYGVAVRKDFPALTQAVNAVIAEGRRSK